MKYQSLFLAILVVASCWCLANDPTNFQAPQGWRGERINFPLSFAKDIPYKGYEQLYFAPGMFKPDSPSYFSYVFFMQIENDVEITSAHLQDIFVKYYRGLCEAVAKSRKIELDIDRVSAEVETAGNPGEFRAIVHCYDAFVTGKELTLNFDIYSWRAKHNYLFVKASPQPRNAAIWKTMEEIHQAFRKNWK